jgi:selenophosphate synthetase-related protein
MFQPGPLSIDPGACPGGVVIRVYDLDGRMLRSSLVPADGDIAAIAEADAGAAVADIDDNDGLILVAYDGDDGHRFTAADWLGLT